MDTENKVTESYLPTKREAPDTEAVVALTLFNEQQRIVDAVIAVARENGWCRDTIDAFDVVYPDGSPWSDGVWRNTQGFDLWGYDTEGYDKDGYDKLGLDRAGQPHPSEWCEQCGINHY